MKPHIHTCPSCGAWSCTRTQCLKPVNAICQQHDPFWVTETKRGLPSKGHRGWQLSVRGGDGEK
jgi:exo-beta-1,3-glucanase (GH17 family)